MGNKKLYVLDTSVLMRNPKCFYVFEDNDVAICEATLEELDNLKEQAGEKGYCARQAIREIFNIKNNEYKINDESTFCIIGGNIEKWKEENNSQYDLKKKDNVIIYSAKVNGGILVTADIAMLIKAENMGVEAEVYRNEQVESNTYTGYTNVVMSSECLSEFYSDKQSEFESDDLVINEFVYIKDLYSDKSVGIGRYDGKYIKPLKYYGLQPCGITPKNAMQKFAIDALMTPAEELPLVILKGPAGTAKTFLSIAAGLSQVMDRSEYRKMLILRPNIKFDDDIGYLKGDEMDKIAPLIRPCMDNLEMLLSNKKDSADEALSKVEYVFQKGYVTAEALAYLRGRSIANTYILVDEAQNSTPQQMLGIISRAGIGSKIVIVGDPDQIDNPKLDKQNNGLVYAAERMKGSKLCAQLTFSESDCVRSELSKEASQLLKIKY